MRSGWWSRLAQVSTDRDWLAYCLAKPGAWRDEPWEGDVVVKVGDKIFAFLGAVDPPGSSGVTSIGLKCGDREAADIQLERYPEAARKMPYIGAHGWNTFSADGTIPVPETMPNPPPVD